MTKNERPITNNPSSTPIAAAATTGTNLAAIASRIAAATNEGYFISGVSL
jgi:hypothetical protein